MVLETGVLETWVLEIGVLKTGVLEEGVLTCSSLGLYRVSYSGQSELNPRDVVVHYLHRNRRQVKESQWTAYTEEETIQGHLAVTGAKTMICSLFLICHI